MKRDIEHIILNTLAIKISEISGIPTGRIFAKAPDFEYVNHPDGSSMPQNNPEKYPSIGMMYFGQGKYKVNKYGSEPIVVKTPTVSLIFQPMGELHLPLSIYLYTNSRKEQRMIGNEISMFLSDALYLQTSGDIISEQFFSIEYLGFQDLSEHRPYCRVMNMNVMAQVYTESTGYVVEEINTAITSIQGSILFQAEPETLTNTITGDSYIDEEVTITFGVSEDDIKLVTEDGIDIAFEI